MLLAILALVAALLLVALAWLASVWLLRPTAEAEDGDEDTVWVDIREWLLLDRLFGVRPHRLTHRSEEPPPGV